MQCGIRALGTPAELEAVLVHQGSVFSAVLADMLGAVAWPPNPWSLLAAPPGSGATAAPGADRRGVGAASKAWAVGQPLLAKEAAQVRPTLDNEQRGCIWTDMIVRERHALCISICHWVAT